MKRGCARDIHEHKLFAFCSSFLFLLRRQCLLRFLLIGATATTTPTHVIRSLAGLQAEPFIVILPQCSEEEEEEDRTRKDVQDAVEDHLSGYRDDIGALREGPANWVKQPNEGDVPCRETIVTLVLDATRVDPEPYCPPMNPMISQPTESRGT